MSQFAYANSFTADGIPSAAAALASPMFPLMPLVDNTVYDTLVADLLALPKQQGVVDNQVPPDSVFSLLDGSGRLVAFKVLSITTRYGFGFSNNAIKGRTLPIPGAVGTDDTKMLTGAPAVNVWSPLTPIMPSGDTDDLPSVIYDMSVPERSAFGGMPTWVSKCSRPSPVSVNSIACDWYLPWAPWTDANRTNWRKFAPLSVSSIGPITGVYFSFTAIVDAVFEQGNPLFVVASHAP